MQFSIRIGVLQEKKFSKEYFFKSINLKAKEPFLFPEFCEF